MTSPVPDWLLERLLLGELPPEEQARLRATLEAEPGGAERLARLEDDSRRTLAALPPESVSREVKRRQAARQRASAPPIPRSHWLWLGPAGAVAAAVLLLAPAHLPRWNPLSGEASPEATRLKGAQPSLRLYRKTAEGSPQWLADRTVAAAGDVVLVTYVAAAHRYGVILSLDGRGGVTLHWPETDAGQAAKLAEGTVALPHAYALDDAPAFERFVLVTAPSPFPVARALEAARSLAQEPARAQEALLPLEGSLPLEQSSVTLTKSPAAEEPR